MKNTGTRGGQERSSYGRSSKRSSDDRREMRGASGRAFGKEDRENHGKSYGRENGENRGRSYGRENGESRRNSRGNERDGHYRKSYGSEAADFRKKNSRTEKPYRKDWNEERQDLAAQRKLEAVSLAYTDSDAYAEEDVYAADAYAAAESHAEEDGRIIEGRNAVLEAFRSGKTVDRLLIQDGCQDGPIQTIKREAKKYGTMIDFVRKERLDQISQTGTHQGVIAYIAAYEYAEVEDILARAKEKGEPPFIILLDEIEDPHNLGAIIRTANLAGAHGVIIPKRRAVGLTATVARTSAGALNYTPVARVTNLGATIEELKKEGIWFVCADMSGDSMYRTNLTGPIGLVIGNEGSGVSRLIREKCDFAASIPMKGDIDSLNASVATGVLAYEIVRQREFAGK